MDIKRILDNRFARWIPAVLTLAIPAGIFWIAYRWDSIVGWWKAPWIGTFVIAITLVASGVALMERKLTSRQKALYLALLGALAILEFRSLKISDDKSKDAQRKADQTQKELNDSFKQLLSDANDTISNMTGGDSFAYVDLTDQNQPSLIIPKLRVEGRYALKLVQLRVIDVENVKKMTGYKGAISPGEWASSRFKTVIDFADVTPAKPMILTETCGIDANPSTGKNYVLELAAPNGTWKEYLRWERINGVSEHAIKVVEMDDRKAESDWKVRKEDVTPGFPRIDGVPDWDH